MSSVSLIEIKEKISVARKQAGITQDEMARLLDISQPAYSYYEKGEKPIPFYKIQKISEILSIPIKSLLGDITREENNEEVLSKISNSLERIADSLDKLCSFLIDKK